jgi:hypothetical protein
LGEAEASARLAALRIRLSTAIDAQSPCDADGEFDAAGKILGGGKHTLCMCSSDKPHCQWCCIDLIPETMTPQDQDEWKSMASSL